MAVNLETPKTKALKKLAGQFPGQAQEQINQSMAANTSQLQASIGAAPSGITDVSKAAQQVGGQMAAAQVEAGQQVQQQLGGQAMTVGQLGMASGNIQGKKVLSEQESQANKKAIDFADRLSKLDSNMKTKLLDDQLAFNKDNRGKILFNERQMLDLAAINAKDQADFQRMAQAAEQASKRQIYMWQTVARKINEEMVRNQAKGEQRLNQNAQRQMIEMKRVAEENARKAANKAKNRMAAWKTGGTMVGMIAGGVVGGPAGASAGGQVGGALGTTAASQSDA